MTKDGPIGLVVLAVGSGAALGALGRWLLAYVLNPRADLLPLGTLAANLLGGYLIGLALAWTSAHPEIPPAVRLFLITGFLGGLTTFSTFSGENVSMLLAGETGRALAHATLHVAGSFAATAPGLWTWRLLH